MTASERLVVVRSLYACAQDPLCGSGNASVAAFLMHTDLIQRIDFQNIYMAEMQFGWQRRVGWRRPAIEEIEATQLAE